MFRRLIRTTLGVVLGLVVATLLGNHPARALTYDFTVSGEASNYQTAVARVDYECNHGAPVGHAGYLSRKEFDVNTGVIRWSVTTLNRRCPGGVNTTKYAVFGYDGICPVAGWYHNGPDDTHDCIKFQSPSQLSGNNKCQGGRFTNYSVNTCSWQGNWWPIVYGGDGWTQPPTWLVDRTYTFSRQIPNWQTSKQQNGGYNFIDNQSLCAYWVAGGREVGSQWCQYILAGVNWTTQWTIKATSYIGNQGRNSNGSVKNGKTGFTALPKVRPNQVLYWDHYLFNNGPDSIWSNGLEVHVDDELGPLNGGRNWDWNSQAPWYDFVAANSSGHRGNRGSTFYTNRNSLIRNNPSRTKVDQSDVDRKICQRTAWLQQSWNSNSTTWGHSDWACANVPYHYPGCRSAVNCRYDPSTNDDPARDCTFYGNCPDGQATHYGVRPSARINKEAITIGDDFTFSYTIAHQSNPTKTRPITAKAYVFIVKGGGSIDLTGPRAYNGINFANVNCSSGQNRGINRSVVRYCLNVLTKTNIVINPGATYGNMTFSSSLGNKGWDQVQVGDRICSYVAIDNWAVYDGSPAQSVNASNIACAKVGKKPQIQINGSDSFAKGGFAGSSYSDRDLVRGSYSQYNLLAGESIGNFGSTGYTSTSSVNQNQACQGSIANVATASGGCNYKSSLGSAGLTHVLSLPILGQSTKLPSGSINLATLTSGQYYYSGSELRVWGNPKPGQHVLLYSQGNIRVTANVEFGEDTGYLSVADLPSVILMAKGNVMVDPSVIALYATSIAQTGKFISCADADSGADLGLSGKCNHKLKINGSVISSAGLQLQRTYGAGKSAVVNQWASDNATATSEWFNYNPNTWLTQYLSGGDNIVGFRVTAAQSLPTRY